MERGRSRKEAQKKNRITSGTRDKANAQKYPADHADMFTQQGSPQKHRTSTAAGGLPGCYDGTSLYAAVGASQVDAYVAQFFYKGSRRENLSAVPRPRKLTTRSCETAPLTHGLLGTPHPPRFCNSILSIGDLLNRFKIGWN